MTATLQLTRKWGGVTDRRGKWQILIDGTAVGSIDRQQTVELPVEPDTTRCASSRPSAS